MISPPSITVLTLTPWRVGIRERDVGHAVRSAFSLESRIPGMVERNNAAFESAEDLADRRRGDGHRSPAFHLALELKYFLGDIPADQAVIEADRLLRERGGWEALPQTDVWGNEYDPCDAFAEAWDVIDEALAPAAEPADALPLADEYPLNCDRWPLQRQAALRRAVSVAFWYARLLGRGGRFYLTGRMLGEVVGVSHVQASAYLKRMVREGLLEVRKKGRQGRATRYTFQFEEVVYEPAQVVELGRGEAAS